MFFPQLRDSGPSSSLQRRPQRFSSKSSGDPHLVEPNVKSARLSYQTDLSRWIHVIGLSS
jgi:hypothetical protein